MIEQSLQSRQSEAWRTRNRSRLFLEPHDPVSFFVRQPHSQAHAAGSFTRVAGGSGEPRSQDKFEPGRLQAAHGMERQIPQLTSRRFVPQHRDRLWKDVFQQMGFCGQL